MKPSFNIFDSDLAGIKLIEASAGTGKTYTLAGLYLRYIVEDQLLPEQILVLTFTKAATNELKTRLRQQLLECKHAIQYQLQVEDESFRKLYQKYANSPHAIKSIDLAIACFDQAAIFTINSFCQKIIDDYNSYCGAPVFKELIDKRDYVEQFVYQFWRQQQNTSPIEFLNAQPSISAIIDKFSSLLGKSHYRDIPPKFDWFQTQKLYAQFKSLKQLWRQQQQTLLDYLLAGNFNGTMYKVANRQLYLSQMDVFFYDLSADVNRFRSSIIESKTNKNKNPGTMPEFFIKFDEFYTLIKDTSKPEKNTNHICLSYLYACWKYLIQQLMTLQSEQGKYGYDDQIRIVSDAVKRHPQLTDQIAQQYRCVMVDEFQDTDSQQLDIFQHCFFNKSHSVIFVGDPKQAIYEFRGADVFVYQQAKQSINQHFSLNTNWRSSLKMLAATNTMFNFDNSFKMSWIEFQPSLTKPNHTEKLVDALPPIMQMDVETHLRLNSVAAEINRLLLNAHIKVGDDETSIQENDIAILVKSNKEALQTYEFLLSQNLNVSLWSDVGVFATDMAKQLYYLIRAIEYPNQTNIFTCLHGRFFEMSLNELQNIDLENWINEFIKYKIEIQENGLIQALESIFLHYKVYQNLLKKTDGERNYTDLLQLLELLQEKTELGFNLEQALEWIADEIDQKKLDTEDEQRKRRLESDGQKISILTMHKSKGLEFNIVFIPFSESIKVAPNNDNINIKAIIAVHDEQQNGVICWQHSNSNTKIYNDEKAAETIRLLYVALTRAKHRMYLGYDSQQKSFNSLPIYPLLENLKQKPQLSGQLNLEHQTSFVCQQAPKPNLSINAFNRDIEQAQSIYSFSYLASSQNIENTFINEDIEEIDFQNYLHFPKGSKSGTMQHTLFENIDFNANLATIKIETQKLLDSNDFDKKWTDCLSQQIHLVLNTQLTNDGIMLSQLKNSLDEMEFILPIGKIKHQHIAKWLSQHRGENCNFKHEALKGFLTGYIDLVFEHESKFYVLDYKSNHLGSSFEDYSTQNLKLAIEDHYYDLQYLLYSVALIKYLKLHIQDFNYQKHFGGVIYLFTRGVNGETGQGVYQNLPDESLIHHMLEAFSV